MIDLREELAALAHEQWSGWMRYMFNVCPDREGGHKEIPASLVIRWQRQVDTAYADLPEEEKESDRQEADRVLALLTEAEQG